MQIAISLKGRSHEANGLPCQDFCLAERTSTKAWLALADGAGSCAHSHHGAKVCVEAARNALWANRAAWGKAEGAWERPLRAALMKSFRAALEAEARKRDCAPAALSCTLMTVQAYKDGFLAAHIGDGALGCIHFDGTLSVLSAPENGRFAHQTYFLTSPDAEAHLRLYRGPLEGVAGFVAMSDGAAESLFSASEGRFAPLLEGLFWRLRLFGAEAVEAWFREPFEAVVREQTRDDVSVACVLCPDISSLAPWKLPNAALCHLSGTTVSKHVSAAMCKALYHLRNGKPISKKSLEKKIHLGFSKEDTEALFWKPLRKTGLVESAGGGEWRIAEAFADEDDQ